uniref:Uncharacterized protein n=1 Tax=Panagrolaimus davidi TaxID=227884 RepID=A0A914R3Z6_9BILA
MHFNVILFQVPPEYGYIVQPLSAMLRFNDDERKNSSLSTPNFTQYMEMVVTFFQYMRPGGKEIKPCHGLMEPSQRDANRDNILANRQILYCLKRLSELNKVSLFSLGTFLQNLNEGSNQQWHWQEKNKQEPDFEEYADDERAVEIDDSDDDWMLQVYLRPTSAKEKNVLAIRPTLAFGQSPSSTLRRKNSAPSLPQMGAPVREMNDSDDDWHGGKRIKPCHGLMEPSQRDANRDNILS